MLTNIVFIIQSFVPKKFFPLISGRSAFLYNGTTGTPREGAKRKAGRNYLQSNVKKKNILYGCRQKKQPNMLTGDDKIKQVQQLKYLRIVLNSKRRMWHRNPKTLWDSERCLSKININISRGTKKRVLNNYVIFVLLYDSEC